MLFLIMLRLLVNRQDMNQLYLAYFMHIYSFSLREVPSEQGQVQSGALFSITIVKCLLKRKQFNSRSLMSFSSTFLAFSTQYLESMQAVSSSTFVFRLVSSFVRAYLARSPQGFKMFFSCSLTAAHQLLEFSMERFSQYPPPMAVTLCTKLMILYSMKASLRKTISSTCEVTASSVSVKQMRAFLMYLPAQRQERLKIQGAFGISKFTLPTSYLMNSRGLILSLNFIVSMRNRNALTFSDMTGQGGSLRQWLSMRLISLGIELSSYGHTPKSISQRMTPSDQMSALESQTSPLSTSGAMQMGDPTIVCVISFSLSSYLQKPKSASFITPSLNKILVGLRSLCNIWASYSAANAILSCSKILRASSSGNLPLFLMYQASVPPLQNQQMRQKLLVVLSISTNLMMLGWVILLRMLISLLVNSVSLGVCLNLSLFITFTAYNCLFFLCSARQTLPYCPEPIFSCKMQSSITLFIKIIDDYNENQ